MNNLLKNLHSSATEMGLYSSNLANKDKRLVVIVEGVSYTCSPRLTKDVREHKVTVDELGDFVVRDVEAEDGTAMKSLGYPGEDVKVAVAWKASDKAVVKQLTVEQLADLIAF
jgi:hypothetical protein